MNDLHRPTRTGFAQRILGALRLDPAVYEEIEHDPNALPQALGIVVLSSVATGLGRIEQTGAAVITTGVVFAQIGWVVWAALVFVIGTRLVPQQQTRSTVPELLRVTGYAASPGLFGPVGLVPFVGPLLFLGVSVWMLLAMLVAVRQALDFTSTWRALGVVSIGWVVYLALIVVAATLGAG